MNALTAVQNNAVDSGQDYSGFTLIPSAQSPRLLELTFTEQTTKQFLEQVAEWPVPGAGVQIVSAFSGRQNSRRSVCESAATAAVEDPVKPR